MCGCVPPRYGPEKVWPGDGADGSENLQALLRRLWGAQAGFGWVLDQEERVEDSLPRPKGSAGDRLLASLAEPKLAKQYTGRGWLVR
jgi:hypothetical protein